jgi:hypothetical protein
VRRSGLTVAFLLMGGLSGQAENPAPCRFLCAPEFKIEPTITFTPLFSSPRIVLDDGSSVRDRRETDFELILSFGLPTRISWLEFTLEAIFLPFDADSTPELEFETNFVWLPAHRTRGWLSSHFDVVDKFSPAERPSDRRAYTHKLNFELDTSVAVFNWLPEGRWLRGVEVEGSLDYVASGLPQRGDVIDGTRFLDNAIPWSFSLVFVLPIAPF